LIELLLIIIAATVVRLAWRAGFRRGHAKGVRDCELLQ
jgi:hypothetical protein